MATRKPPGPPKRPIHSRIAGVRPPTRAKKPTAETTSPPPDKPTAAPPTKSTTAAPPARKPIATPAAVTRAPPTTKLPSPKDDAEALVRRLFDLDRVKADFYAMGEVLRELKRPEMYQALGAASFSDLLRRRRLPRRAMANRLVDIVNGLDAPTARSLGVQRSWYAIQYADVRRTRLAARQLIVRDPRIAFGSRTYKLSTIPTSILEHIVRALRANAPIEPPAALHTTARRLAQRFHHRGYGSARVRSLYRGPDAYVEIRLTLAEAQMLADLLR